MKTKNLIFMFALVMIGGVIVSSCSKDDDKGKENNNSIVGVWKSEMFDADYSKAKSRMPMKAKEPQKKTAVQKCQDFFVYTKDGYEYFIAANFDSKGNFLSSSISYGTYKTVGDKLTETFAFEDEDYTFYIDKDVLTIFTGSEEDGTNAIKYTRSTEKELKPYFDAINPQKKLVGAWSAVNNPQKLDDGRLRYYYNVFYKDGTGWAVWNYFKSNGSFEFSSVRKLSKWSFKDYKFYEEFKNPDDVGNQRFTSFIYLSDNELVQYIMGGVNQKSSFNRVDMDEIQQYIDNALYVNAPVRNTK